MAALVVATIGAFAPPSSAAPQAPAAPAAPAVPDPSRPYSAEASGELLHVTALDIEDAVTVADLGVTLANAAVNSGPEGLDGNAAIKSSALGQNLAPLALLDQLDLSDLLVSASQTAPPNNAAPATDTLIDVPASPLIDANVSNATAEAHWASDTACVSSDTPVAEGYNDVANLVVLGPLPGFGSVVSVDEEGEGVAFTRSSIFLDELEGGQGADPRTVRATSLTQIAGLDLLGTNISVGVSENPRLDARATGLPGGASIDWTAPLLTLQIADQDPIELDLADSPFEISLPLELAPVITLSLSVGTVTGQQTSADGTHAEASASLLSLEVTLLDGLITLADVDVAPMHVEANAPAGGLDCGNPDNPLRELHKDASTATVPPGATFQYVVAVPNRDPSCTLTSVRVVDRVTGPAGFEIVSTAPAASSVSGGTITWNDIGPLAPNEIKNLVITIRVPANARVGSTFSDDVTVTALCNGRAWERPAAIRNIPVVVARGTGPCNVGDSNKAASHLEVFPGETFNYYIHVFNSGAQGCTNVRVTDTLDNRVEFVSASPGCTAAGQTVTCNVGNLAGGESKTVTITVRVRQNATGNLPDTARITTNEGSQKDVSTNGPRVTDRSVLAPPNPPRRSGVLPRTGDDLMPWLAASGLLAALSVGLRRLRRGSIT